MMLNYFLLGALCTACTIIAAFFFQFWQRTRDRLFLCFALAFCLFAANWAMAALAQDSFPAVYLLRLCAFLLIISGVVGKNRRAATSSGRGPGAPNSDSVTPATAAADPAPQAP